MISKGDLVVAALEELRISGLTIKASPEEVVSGIKKMDMMVSSWKNKNICLSYISSTSFNAIDPSQNAGIAESEIYAVVINLAKNLAESYGKEVPRNVSSQAKELMAGLYEVLLPNRESDPYLPTGSGEAYSYYNSMYYGYYNKFFSSEENAPDNCSTFDIKVGQIDLFTVDFTNYLIDGNSISSYEIEDGDGVVVIDSAIQDSSITIKCEGKIKGFSTVKITVTSTPSGRVNPEEVNFNVT